MFGSLARSVYEHKYAMRFADGTKETWNETANRVAHSVVAPYLGEDMADEVEALIRERKFMPGGRYLYASGRKYHQTNNCALFKVGDSREERANLLHRSTHALMTGMGIGVVYSDVRPAGSSVGGLGGVATGPCSLMQMVNETGRHIQQGGSRRSAVWAGLHWSHADVMDFVHLKNWPEWMAAAKRTDFNASATMDGTNISVILDDHFFHAYHAVNHPDHSKARQVYAAVVRQMVTTGEPGLSIDIGKNAGEHLRNAPVSGETRVETEGGYRRVIDIVGKRVSVWTGRQWADTVFKKTAEMVKTVTVEMTGRRSITCDPTHEFILDGGKRVAAKDLTPGDSLLVSLCDEPCCGLMKEAYRLGFLFGDGTFRNGSAEVTLCTPEKKALLPYLTTSGVSHVTEEDSRGYTRVYYKKSILLSGQKKGVFPELGIDDLPSFLAGLFDADGHYSEKNGRVRLSSVHFDFLRDVSRSLESIGVLSHINVGAKGQYKGTPTWTLVVASDYVSRFAAVVPTIRLAVKPHAAYRKSKVKVVSVSPSGRTEDVYCCDVGVDEHSFQAEGVIISNCTEVTSRDDNDICNLGSLVLSRFDSLDEFKDAVEVATAFLLCGTLYSDLPLDELKVTRAKNRRLGLGLMGFHEWLLRRGKRYDPDPELAQWLAAYRDVSDKAAASYADDLGVSRPVAKRAIAPNGTIAIVAETTSSIEPIFAVAFKRRYLKGHTWHYQYVIDSAAERLIQDGIDPDAIEDAYSLAADPGRRLGFQAWVQDYVDQGISSTLNLPEWGSEHNNPDTLEHFSEVLMRYLPRLRGVTAYPDGSRGGQPLTVVPYREAAGKLGVEVTEYGNEQACPGGVCGV